VAQTVRTSVAGEEGCEGGGIKKAGKERCREGGEFHARWRAFDLTIVIHGQNLQVKESD